MDFIIVLVGEEVPKGFDCCEGSLIEDWVSDVGEAVGQNALVC